jgi:predicted hydrocarbon binding protein
MLSALIQKLLFVNQFNIANGKINILGKDYILIDPFTFLILQNIDDSTAYKTAKTGSEKSLKELVEHAKVYQNVKDQSLKEIALLSQKVGKTDDGTIKTLQKVFEIYGLGKLTITNLDNKNKTATLKIENSTMAKAHSKKGNSKKTVCTLCAGVLAGIFSYVFKKDIDCIETKCLAQGNNFCEFKII